jgi:superfamily II DNA or RNA helicase
MIALRPYQSEVIAKVEVAISTGTKRIMLVAPTGSGKTIIAAEIIRNAVASNKRVLVLAHRVEIIKQTSQKLYSNEVEHGVIQAGFATRLDQPVQVASVQTLWTRAVRMKKIELPPADLLIIDEGHHCPAETYKKIIDSYPDAVLIGLTATPCRGDGRGLGGIFDCIIECPQVADLIEQKFLVPTVVYAPSLPDLKGVKTQAGDYVESQLAERMDLDDLVGDIVTHWHKYGERRKTVCFATGVAHSLHITSEFKNAGVRAEHIDGATPKSERDAILRRLADGETELVSNCMVLTEGWDMPEVSCCILARPTKKMGLYRQMVGRVLRPASYKQNAIVLDHAGAVFKHGFVEDRVEWTLSPDRLATSPAHAAWKPSDGYKSRFLECSQCSALRIAGEPCPKCGFMPQRPPKAITFRDGDLGLVNRDSRRAQFEPADPEIQARWHGMLTFIAGERGYKPGWIVYKYKEKFGAWPASRWVSPITPSPEVLSWVRSRQIAYAKAQRKAAR